ncbi:MAG TPA: cation transporter [Flavitalea sp.]|nr:cation transporter [Flavitalea sp.]
MKKVLALVLITTAFLNQGFAQVKKKGIQTVTISTPNVLCEICKDRIEKYMIREDGIQKITVDYKHNKTKVTFFTERTNIENIKTAIANVGFDADDVTANPDSYDKLPSCCKKPTQ